MITTFFAAALQLDQPKVETRPATPYASVAIDVTMDTIGQAMPKSLPKLARWMTEHHVRQTGAPFMRYRHVDMKGMTIEVGFPADKVVKGDSTVQTGTIPKGRYLTVIHHGPYNGLVQANGDLQTYAKQKSLEFKMQKGDFVGRFEFYPTDPSQEPDPSKWETWLAYLIK